MLHYTTRVGSVIWLVPCVQCPPSVSKHPHSVAIFYLCVTMCLGCYSLLFFIKSADLNYMYITVPELSISVHVYHISISSACMYHHS